MSGSIAINYGDTGGGVPVMEEDANEEQTVKEACEELTEHFKHKLVEALLRSTRFSLDVMRKRFFSRYA